MTRFRSIGLFTAGAAMSAALLITGTQAWQVGAAPGDSNATYQPLNPCRLMDTRVDFNVGIRKAPIGPGETFTAQVTGTNGDCVDIPTDATAVAMNVTAVNATAPSNLRIFPADLVDAPLVSNLNYSQTSPPTPNKVDSKLSPDGKIKIFNAFGSVDVIVDIVGVYTNSSLVEINDRLAALEAKDIALAKDIRDAIPTVFQRTGPDVSVDDNWSSVARLSIGGNGRSGTVVAIASVGVNEGVVGADVQCVITDSTNPDDFDETDRSMIWEAAGVLAGNTAGWGKKANLAGSTTFSVTTVSFISVHLMCRNQFTLDGSDIWNPQITLLFVPRR